MLCVASWTTESSLDHSKRRHRDIAVWLLALCWDCAEKSIQDNCRETFAFGLKYGPLLIGIGVGGALVAAATGAILRAGIFMMPLLVGAALLVLVGVWFLGPGLLVGWVILRRQLGRARGRRLADDDKLNILRFEGHRICEALQKSAKTYHGDFSLPGGKRRAVSYSFEE
jgi:hypothetical protein